MKYVNKAAKLCCLILAISMLCGCTLKDTVEHSELSFFTEVTEITAPTTMLIETITENTEPATETDEYTASSEATVHIHNWIDVVKEPTCTDAGYTERVCELCGELTCESVTEPNGHNWDCWKVYKQATATSEGAQRRYCTICGDFEEKPIEKIFVDDTSHTHEYTSSVTSQATCQQVGIMTFTCECGDKYIENIPKAAHKYADIVIAPTCTTKGFIDHICDVCQHNYRDGYIESLSHDYVATVTVATCTDDGYTTYRCKNCGDNYTDDKVRAKGHDYKETVTKPTCTKDGYSTCKCDLCGDTYTTAQTAASGHTWSDWHIGKEPTETEAGFNQRSCSTCGAVETSPIEPLKSSEPAESHTHSYTVTRTSEATCESDGFRIETCECGDEKTIVVPALGHDWESHHEDELGHWDVYIVCHCGWQCSAEVDYIVAYASHIESLSVEERFNHSYYENAIWVIDTPAKDWGKCFRCGAVN